MIGKPTHNALRSPFCTTFFFLLLCNYVVSMDSVLVEAEKSWRVIKVRKDGSGEFKTVSEAVDSVPEGNVVRSVVWIGPGEYREKITVRRLKPFITFYGSQGEENMPKLTFDGTAKKYGTVVSATVAVEADYFTAVNIVFENSAPEPDGKREGAQAVAMRISGNKAAFYNCKFFGFQDTLCDHKGTHFFTNCYIQGTVDFIFGRGKSLYLDTELHSVSKGFAAITAQAREREDDDSGFSFVHCNITGTGDIHLGRMWRERAIVIFAYTYMTQNVNPQGWFMDPKLSTKDVFYGEYKCEGPGASTEKRPACVKMLTDEEAKPYLDKSYINASDWLLPPIKL